MRRIILLAISIMLLAAHCDRPPEISYSGLKSNAEQVTGQIDLVPGDKRDNCSILAKQKIIDKMLYYGFEGTSYHRPRLEDNNNVPERVLDRLYPLVYLQKKSTGEPGRCSFEFTLNIRSAIRILENEDIITDFGV